MNKHPLSGMELLPGIKSVFVNGKRYTRLSFERAKRLEFARKKIGRKSKTISLLGS
ncbi:MAG: hypothetical protein ACPHXS_03015 [Flavobacteriaceae bacterium]